MAKRALIFLGIFLALCFGLLAWYTNGGAKAIEARRVNRLTEGALTTMTAEDVKTVLESQYKTQPQTLQQLASSVEARKNQLEKVFKPVLALGREARLTGLAEEPEMREQLELMEMTVLAFGYDEKLKKDAGKENDQAPPLGWVEQKISKEEIDAFWANKENDVKFEKFIKTLVETSPNKQPVPEDQKAEIRSQWGVAMIAARLAKASGLDKDPAIRLQIGFQEARLLATEYGKRHAKDIEVTKDEIAAYVKSHPELDPKSRRTKAEEALKRAKAGEDFGKLANEYSEDPGLKGEAGKGKDGLYENVKKGAFVPQFEVAALALQPGGISDLVESQFGFHVIKLESKGTTKGADGKDEETFSARHILIQTTAQDPANPYAKPVPLEQKAKQAAQQAKIEKFLEELYARNPVSLPEAEAVVLNVPEMPATDPMQGLPQGMEMEMETPAQSGKTGGNADQKANQPKAGTTAKPKSGK